MKTLLLILMVFPVYASLSAQDSIVTIKPGYKINEVLKPSDVFYYPLFTGGKVFFRDGSKAVAEMNYNQLTDQMLFIDPKGDTLALANEKDVKLIVVGPDTFYFNDGYIRLIAGNDIIKVAERKIWAVADVRKNGAFNTSTNSVSITSLSSFADGNGRAKSYDLLANEDLLIKKQSQYYFGDKYNNFDIAGKKKLLLLFPKEHVALEDYLKENRVNFDDKNDLKKITQFLVQYR